MSGNGVAVHGRLRPRGRRRVKLVFSGPDARVLGTTTEVDGLLRTSVRVSHYHGLKRLLASMPGVATVVAPKSARDAVAEWAAAGAARYR